MQQSVISKVKFILDYLDKKYPDAKCSLRHDNPFQLLIATILSAQCTDARVNIVTEKLFERYKTPQDFAAADIKELKNIIKPTGFFNNKAINIKNMAIKLIENYNGNIPQNMQELLSLPGVGRKTANVILGNCFVPEGIVVDTHVKRVSKRLGLTNNDNPDKIESDLVKIIPKEKWNIFSHQVILFGREICASRKPKCDVCGLNTICSYYKGY
jgi:endonuclease-3